MLRFTCPCCGAVNEIDALVHHEYARKAVVAAAQLPPELFGRTMRYLRLFVSANAPQRNLTMDRAATLLDALVQAVSAGKVEARGRDWSAPLAAWAPAFDAVFERVDSGALKTPLKTHAYLFGCIANMADGVEAKQEQAVEAQRKGGRVVSQRTETAYSVEQAVARGEAVFVDLSTNVANGPQPTLNGESSEKPNREIPPEALAVMASITSRKSMQAVSAQQAILDAPADPLLGQFAAITKGKWKGKGGTIVRVVGDQVYLAIQFARNGLQTIPFNRAELSL